MKNTRTYKTKNKSKPIARRKENKAQGKAQHTEDTPASFSLLGVRPSTLGVQSSPLFHNELRSKKAAGASRRDLTQMRVYMVDYTPNYIEILMPVFKAFFGDVPPPAQTWVGVQALALPEFLIEIEAVAVRS